MNVVTFGWNPLKKRDKPPEEPKLPRVYGQDDLNALVKSAEHVAMSKQYGVYGYDSNMQAAQVLLLRDLSTKVGQLLAQQGQSKPDSGPSPSIH